MSAYNLGIDIGTTSVKCCIQNGAEAVATARRYHNATISNLPPLHEEQDPLLILDALDQCLNELKQFLKRVGRVSICGQMHGVILWKNISSGSSEADDVHANQSMPLRHHDDVMTLVDLYKHVVASSNLITWQDQRCDSIFIQKLPRSPSECRISSGFGWASISWLAEHQLLDTTYTSCGTIMDFLVWLLTRNDDVMMSPHNANSWGYFDVSTSSWEMESLAELLNKSQLKIPTIVKVGSIAGQLFLPIHSMTTDVTVQVALGDMQCAIRAANPTKFEAVLNIGTSSQLSYIAAKNKTDVKSLLNCYPALDCVPYDEEHFVITAASMNGGNVIDSFASMIQTWLVDLEYDTEHNKDNLFSKIEQLALSFMRRKSPSTLKVVPTPYPERYDLTKNASVENITLTNCSLPEVSYSIYRGLIDNLVKMLPCELLKQNSIKKLVCIGGLLTSSEALRRIVEEVTQLSIRTCNEIDASVGATCFQC